MPELEASSLVVLQVQFVFFHVSSVYLVFINNYNIVASEWTLLGDCDSCPYERVDTFNAKNRPWYVSISLLTIHSSIYLFFYLTIGLFYCCFICSLLFYLSIVVLFIYCCFICPLLFYLSIVVLFIHCCFICPLLFYLSIVVLFIHCCFICLLFFYLSIVVLFVHCCFINPFRYINTVLGEKHSVILIDMSGSMTGSYSTLARLTATEFINSLSPNDFFLVLRVGETNPSFKPFGNCFNKLVRASSENKLVITTILSEVDDPVGVADFEAAMTAAYNQLLVRNDFSIAMFIHSSIHPSIISFVHYSI